MEQIWELIKNVPVTFRILETADEHFYERDFSTIIGRCK